MAFDSALVDAVHTYGAWLVGGVIALESMGIPVPGETMLISAAVYAGATGKLNISYVILAAVVGAIVGDNAGFWIGRTVGIRWVNRHQSFLHLTPRRLKVGQYLFMRHGGKVVFFGRFIAVLRAWAAFFAGLNCMDSRRFLLFNALGAVAWAGVYGLGAYEFGEKLTNQMSEAGVILAVAAVLGLVIAFLVGRRYERAWEDAAERALPGPLTATQPCAR